MVTGQRFVQPRVEFQLPLLKHFRTNHHGDVIDLAVLVVKTVAATTKADTAGALVNRIAPLPTPLLKTARGLALEQVGVTITVLR